MRLLAIMAAAAAPALAAASTELVESAGPGARAFQKCYSCHSLEPGPKLEGPNLAGIVGMPVGARPDFDYSPAMQRFATRHPVWTKELLDRFITDPEAVVPGTTMTFTGITDPNERAALLDYLERPGTAGE